MISVKKLISTASVALLLGTAALVATAGAASARMVCNADGDCWHTDDAQTVYPGTGYAYHPDDWYFHQTWDQNHHYRDYHDGRGYYKGGLWITL